MHGRDVVPSLPPARLGFVHTGQGVHLDRSKALATPLPAAYTRPVLGVVAAASCGSGVDDHGVDDYIAALHRLRSASS